MGIMDVFKQNKKTQKRGNGKARSLRVKKAEERKEIQGSNDVPLSAPAKNIKKKDFSEAYKILKSPHITEKATDAGEENRYTFKVFKNANKIEIKKAIKDLYGVSVLNVNIINIHQKNKKLSGRRGGYKEGYKKAIVTLQEGHVIEILPR